MKKLKVGKMSEFTGWLIEYRSRSSDKWRHWLNLEPLSQRDAEKVLRSQRKFSQMKYMRLCRLVKTPMEEGE